jgi:serine/threonine-protein kinase
MTNDFPEVGTLIDGVYRVTGLLGVGAMGLVLAAYDEKLDRTVAIKLIKPKMLDERFRGRFHAEARAMARVSHPNLLEIHAFGEHQGAPYFVMECVDGLTLEDWLAENDPVEPYVAVRILEQICAGVAAIHAADTVHRDLKPSNVLMDRQGNVRVADLGLAVNRIEDANPSREVVGTPAYMAPEVGFPRPGEAPVGTLADVYAIGCIAYELLTGSPPFVAEHSLGVMCQHATIPVEPPSRRRPSIPPILDEIVLKALAKDPKERISSVESLGAALHAAAEGASEPTRILVAEDNDDAREMLCYVLQGAFPAAVVEAFDNGHAALEAFDRNRPSVAILDLLMPELDGKELTKILRARDPEWNVPIIMLTASGSAADWKQLRELGADRFLLKPVILDDVVAMVRHLLKERSVSQPSPESRATPAMSVTQASALVKGELRRAAAI